LTSDTGQMEYWRKEARPNSRTGENTAEYVAREFSNDLIERMFLFDAVGWSSLSNKLVPEKSLPYQDRDAQVAPKDRFKFAALEGDLEVGSGCCPLSFDTGLGVTGPKADADIDSWTALFLKQIEAAIENGADVICAGEFAFPPLNAEHETEIQNSIRGLISQAGRPIFIVPGSRHARTEAEECADGTTLDGLFHHTNSSMIFGGDASGCEDFEQRVEKLPLNYSKRSPSVGLGERLVSPQDPNIPIFVTPFANISVLICSDAFDPRILFSFLRQNERKFNKAQFILVPSYNRSKLFDESCMYLSYLANTTVVCVNSKKNTFPDNCVRFFVAGVELTSFSELLRHKKDEMKIADEAEMEAIQNCIRMTNLVEVKSDVEDPAGGPQQTRRVALYDIDVVHTANFAKRASNTAGPLLKTARRSFEKFKK